MADMTQMTGDYAISWLPWIMIPMVFYILPFPIIAIVFLWIEREGGSEQAMGQDLSSPSALGADAMGATPPAGGIQ